MSPLTGGGQDASLDESEVTILLLRSLQMTAKTRMVIASEQYKKEAVIANWQSATTLDNGWSVLLVAGPVLVEAGRAGDQGCWSQLKPQDQDVLFVL